MARTRTRAKARAGKRFDGRKNFPVDDSVEQLLETHFQKFGISRIETLKHFPIYARRVHLKRFLAHYELFRMTVDLPGDIIELGVYWGLSLMSWANFLEIRNMGDRQKQVFGFDNFAGFAAFDEKDGAASAKVNKVIGGFDGGVFEEILEDAIRVFDNDRFVPYKQRVVLVKGDIEKTVPQFVKEHPGLRISLLHFDCDVYRPTKKALECLWPLVVKGGVVLFDEYGIRPWEGESMAVDEFFKGQNIAIRRFDWAPNPGGYVVK